MKVALVYDRINKWGGAERVLLALHEIWPEAPLYTAVYDPKKAPWAKVFTVKPSFLQYLPLARSHHELYPWLTPLAFETFSFDEYDVVISVTSAEAKGIITKPKTLHICYCLTPTRYLWSGYEQYQTNPGMGSLSGLARATHALFAPTLRRWDLVAASRPDTYIAISGHVAERMKKYYGRTVERVIYPPVDLKKFLVRRSRFKGSQGSYFLVVSRLVGYKRVDLVIEAFNKLRWPLVVVGDGWQKEELKWIARNNITFVDRHLTDTELSSYYQRCRALVHAAQEDFGLVAVEAQACGKPVIAYAQSGIADVVKDKVTGILFRQQSVDSLVAGLKQFEAMSFDLETLQKQVRPFDARRFNKKMKSTIERLYQAWTRGGSI